ncbi:hypothetical protein [Streptomyces sp. NPDC013181]|uniref:hypothetical protein n=1 Tax=Streptomyces sp. NPDC013181 TaxID=3364864 RepID=UPI003696E7C6
MDVYIEVSLDRGAGECGRTTERWFTCALDMLFSGLLRSRTDWYAAINREESSPAERFYGQRRGLEDFMESVRAGSCYGHLGFSEEDCRLGYIETSSALMEGMSTLNTVGLPATPSDFSDPGFCSGIVNFLLTALNGANPTFGRVDIGQFTERTNLDVALRRKVTKSMSSGRGTLRGYAWVTIVPQELIERLGGWEELESGDAFFKVFPLPDGGAILQASETMSGYTDEAMWHIFKTLAPVLPTGMPEYHAASQKTVSPHMTPENSSSKPLESRKGAPAY